ncbi:MAG: chorismate mutase [Nanoarchaeota archaeon]|nr:chorismate mutase [Nanoarchaeota archaeon]
MIDKFRKEIDSVDRRIISLLEERMKISKRIGDFKRKNNLKIRDVKREKEFVERVLKKTALDGNFVKSFYQLIFKFSRKVQK